MTSFELWQKWLQEKVTSHEGDLNIRYFCNTTTAKPVAIVQVTGKHRLGQFSVWATGEADYEVAQENGKMVQHKWGMQLQTDDSDLAFGEFLKAVMDEN